MPTAQWCIYMHETSAHNMVTGVTSPHVNSRTVRKRPVKLIFLQYEKPSERVRLCPILNGLLLHANILLSPANKPHLCSVGQEPQLDINLTSSTPRTLR